MIALDVINIFIIKGLQMTLRSYEITMIPFNQRFQKHEIYRLLINDNNTSDKSEINKTNSINSLKLIHSS